MLYIYSFQVAYTFDAGPNATLYLLEENVTEFLGVLDYFFPPTTNLEEYRKGLPVKKVVHSLVNIIIFDIIIISYLMHLIIFDFILGTIQ